MRDHSRRSTRRTWGSTGIAKRLSSLIPRSRESHTSPVKVAQVLSELTPEECEIAAMASYDYMNKSPAERKSSATDGYAQHIIRRFLESRKGNVPKATQRLKATLKFRREMDVEGLIKAFPVENEYSKPLKEQLKSKKLYGKSSSSADHSS